jgi:hypothetical protein
VAVLGPRAFRVVRLDRNRNVITAEEQNRLGTLRIGVAGLSDLDARRRLTRQRSRARSGPVQRQGCRCRSAGVGASEPAQ